MKAALLERGKVIGEVFDAPEKESTIEVAGAFTIQGDPVNVHTYKISRSVKNLEEAKYCQPVSKIGNVWTFLCVQNGKVVY